LPKAVTRNLRRNRNIATSIALSAGFAFAAQQAFTSSAEDTGTPGDELRVCNSKNSVGEIEIEIPSNSNLSNSASSLKFGMLTSVSPELRRQGCPSGTLNGCDEGPPLTTEVDRQDNLLLTVLDIP
jgi:hypothetical protein|tara:strand:+ start:143 stop:520 length:378 start_codon:yes stop_codon:yes gene_type:complete